MEEQIKIEEVIENNTTVGEEQTSTQTEKKEENESYVISIEIRTPTSSGLINVLQNDSIQSLWSLIENNQQLFQYSNYELYLINDNVNINKFPEIKDIPGIKDRKLVLKLQPLPYTETSALTHFKNMRNFFFDNKVTAPKTLLQFYKTNNKENNNTINSNKKKKKKKPQNTNNQNETNEENSQTFKDIYPENWQRKKTQLVKSIIFSGWNPALEYRKLSGDLFYFVITTTEGKKIHFTACEQGFYANKSDDNKFNPEALMEDHKIYHLLIDCLSATITGFSQKVQKYLQEISQSNIFDVESELFKSCQWISPGYSHTYSASQGDSYIESFKITDSGVLREWNIEFQFCKELPETNNEEIMRKYGIWVKSSTEFINSASVAARLLVDGDITPVNIEDPISEQIYIYNNIFLTRALDSKEQMKDRGGEKSVRKLFTNEIISQTIFNSVNIPNIFTLGMTVVDYRGHRIIAQSLLPGIFQSETTSDVKYGSIDFGEELKYNEEFIEPLKEFEQFGLSPHIFTDQSGNSKQIYTAVETKMLVGTDGRKYLLDLVRFTPRDANYPEKENYSCVLRPELLNHCSIAKMETEIKKAILERNKEYETDPKLIETHWDEVKDKYTEVQEQIDLQRKQEILFETELIKRSKLQKKNELLQKKKLEKKGKESESKEEVEEKEDQKEVLELSKEELELNENETQFIKEREEKRKENELLMKKQLLLEEIELKVRQGFKQPLYNPNIFVYDDKLEKTEKIKEDEKAIVEVSNILKDNLIPGFAQNYSTHNIFDTETLADVLHREGINLRYCGQIAELSKENDTPHLTSLVEGLMIVRRFKEIINEKLTSISKNKVTAFLSKHINLLLGTGNGKKSEVLYEQIKKKVKEHYKYDLPTSIPSSIRSYATLRSVCLQLGIQILCKDYDFNKNDPLQTYDIIQLTPRIHSPKLYQEILEIIKTGHQHFNEGNYYFAQQIFAHAHETTLFIFGPVHPNTAVASSNLASVLMTLNDKSCIELFENATMIYERTNGVDSPSAIYGYFDLSTAHSKFGNFEQALVYSNRALFLLSTYIDKKHPIYLDNLIKLAKLQFYAKNPEACFTLFHEILETLENQKKTPQEPDSALIARVCKNLSNCYKEDEKYKSALSYERRYFNFCSATFGSKDNRTKEASMTLQELTSLAVMQQKKMNEKKPLQPKVSKPQTPPVRTLPGINDMPLSKILSFINGKVPINFSKDSSEARANFEMNFGKKPTTNPKKKK